MKPYTYLLALLVCCLPGACTIQQRHAAGKYNAELLKAVSENDSLQAARLLEWGADVNSADEKGHTALMMASDNKYLSIARLLLQYRPAVNVQDSAGQRTLNIAARNGHTALVELLLQNGADPETGNERYPTALYSAIGSRKPETVQALLQHGVNVNHENKDGLYRSPLLEAIILSDTAIMRLLLDNGANPDKVSGEYGMAPVVQAARLPRDTLATTLKLLMAYGADINTADSGGVTALHASMYQLDATRALYVLEQGGNITAKDKQGNMPLHHAVLPGTLRNGGHKLDIIGMLLAGGAGINVPDKAGRTPLHQCWDTVTAQFLIDHGADVNAADTQGHTPLMHFTRTAFYNMPGILAEQGARLEARDNKGRTALLWAAGYGDHTMLTTLVSLGADMHVRDSAGRTALMYVARRHALQTARYLVQNGADINAQDQYGHTALMVAVQSHYSTMIQLLMKSGADPAIKNHQGKTALDYAKFDTEKKLLGKE